MSQSCRPIYAIDYGTCIDAYTLTERSAPNWEGKTSAALPNGFVDAVRQKYANDPMRILYAAETGDIIAASVEKLVGNIEAHEFESVYNVLNGWMRKNERVDLFAAILNEPALRDALIDTMLPLLGEGNPFHSTALMALRFPHEFVEVQALQKR